MLSLKYNCSNFMSFGDHLDNFLAQLLKVLKLKLSPVLPADKKCSAVAWWENLKIFWVVSLQKYFTMSELKYFIPPLHFLQSIQDTIQSFYMKRKRFYIKQNQWNILQLFSIFSLFFSFRLYVFFRKIYYSALLTDCWAFKFYFAAPYELLLKDFRCYGVWNN